MNPTGWVLLAAGALALIVATERWLDWYRGRVVERMRDEFQEAFPGECFMCSFYDYGRREFGSGELPPSHNCPEHWRRWRSRFRRT